MAQNVDRISEKVINLGMSIKLTVEVLGVAAPPTKSKSLFFHDKLTQINLILGQFEHLMPCAFETWNHK